MTMIARIITGAVLLCAFLPALRAEPALYNSEGSAASLPDIDSMFITSRLDALQLAGECRVSFPDTWPRTDFRYLETQYATSLLRLYVQPDVIRSSKVLIVQQVDNRLVAWSDCSKNVSDLLLPVLAIMGTYRFEEDPWDKQIRQAVLADHSFLTSHEPSMLMARNDSLHSSATYLDFQVSAKHPLFANAVLFNDLHGNVADALEKITPGDDEFFIQLYLSFTGRFSQHLFDRNSSPVVSRIFNPSLFYRIWSSTDNYLDLEFGHESNGQRIRRPEGLQRAEADFLAEGEPADYARDSLSRGWDYVGAGWQRNWNNLWLTRIRMRHFLKNGPLQGRPEEYNLWEDGGSVLRPRRQYDGLSLTLQYNFNESRCLLDSVHVCLSSIRYHHDTGQTKLFDRNTSTLELTTDFFGIPVQLWGKSGYNTNLVDYYRQTTSWGLGFQLFNR